MPRCCGGQRSGSTLIEVVIATMVFAIAAAAAGAVLVSALTVKRTNRARSAMVGEIASLKDELRNYVTADTAVTHGAPGSPPWHMPEDASCNACWALSPGIHDVSARLSEELREEMKGELKYTVSVEKFMGRDVTHVIFSAKWDGGGNVLAR